MVLAKPVVASRVGGVAEAVADRETGLLVPAEDAGALATALTRCLMDASLRERMGKAGRERVAAFFGAERHAKLVESEYQRLIAMDNPPKRGMDNPPKGGMDGQQPKGKGR